MDRYWSYVATPLFFTTIGFGVFTLFNAQEVQFESTKAAEKTAGLVAAGTATPAAAPAANSYIKATPSKPGRAHTPKGTNAHKDNADDEDPISVYPTSLLSPYNLAAKPKPKPKPNP